MYKNYESLESQILRDNKLNIIFNFFNFCFFFTYIFVEIYTRLQITRNKIIIYIYCRLFVKMLNVLRVCNNCIISRLEIEFYSEYCLSHFYVQKEFRKSPRATFSSNIGGNFSISSIRICNTLFRHPECRPAAPQNSMQYKNLQNLYNFLMPIPRGAGFPL